MSHRCIIKIHYKKKGEKSIDFYSFSFPGTQEHRVLISLSVIPTSSDTAPRPLVSLDAASEFSENTSLIYPRRLQCIKAGLDSALVSGPKLGCPVLGVRVLVHWLEVGRHTSDSVISSCTTQCVHKVSAGFSHGSLNTSKLSLRPQNALVNKRGPIFSCIW